MGSVVQGQALGGMFACAMNVFLIAMGATEERTAFYCFLISIVFLSLSLASYLFVTRTPFYKVSLKYDIILPTFLDELMASSYSALLCNYLLAF